MHGTKFSSIRKLIEKYSGQCPRYTSYPTAVEFAASFGPAQWHNSLEQDSKSLSPTDTHSIYVHLPFCPSLCYFCACNKIITQDRSRVAPYLQTLIREFDQVRDVIGSNISLEQIHWGGGTPNYLTPEEMIELHEATLARFPGVRPGADVSIEIDPRTLRREHLVALRALGFTRVSFGVQDFNPEVQAAVNRIQPFEMTRDVCDWSRELGFAGINVDLIYGLPGQTLEGFADTLVKVGLLRPDRIALYGYAHVTWITKAQKALERVHLPTPSERISLLLLALERLGDLGYEHIGLDHFALPTDSLTQARDSGKLNRNFMGYTTHRGARILGFGVSAISSLPGAFSQNAKDLVGYGAAINRGEFSTERGLTRTAEDQVRGEIIDRLLSLGRFDVKLARAVEGIDPAAIFAQALPILGGYAEDGMVELSADSVVLTPLGRLFGRNIASTFDAYLLQHRQGERKVFSQAV